MQLFGVDLLKKIYYLHTELVYVTILVYDCLDFGGFMPAGRLKHYLDGHNIQYETITHPIAFSTLQLCEVCHIPSKDMAKSVICKTKDKLFMVVMRAHDQVDLGALSEHMHTDVSLATEAEFSNEFPDCELGAMPPFGNLYDMDVLVDDRLKHDETIAFNAGNHSELVKIKYKDFEKLVHPTPIHFPH